MEKLRRRAICFVAGAILSLGSGCGANRERDAGAALRRLSTRAVRLYTEIHPLRSSRLGIIGADSLLFTFGDEELREVVNRLESLVEQFAALPVENLPARDRDEALVMIHWARGELFALENLGMHRASPLLYTWIAEETLWEMPTRFDPPRHGEAEAYRKRLLALPGLFANGALHLHMPPRENARNAVLRLDFLAATLDGLGSLAAARYGRSFEGELGLVRKSLLEFRESVSLFGGSGARGHLIIGAENLSKVFLYDELLNIDPNMLLAEAERRIARFVADRSSTEKRIEYETGTPLSGRRQSGEGAAVQAGESGVGRSGVPTRGAAERVETFAARVIDTLWTSSARMAPFGSPHGPRPALRYPAENRYRSVLPKNPILSLPPSEVSPVVAGIPPFAGPACRPFVNLSGDAPHFNEEALRYALLAAAPAMLESQLTLCESKDTAAAVFASETWREGCIHLARLDMADELRKNDPALYMRFIDEELRHLARMIIVLRLHTGTLTTEGSVSYLIETTRVSRDEAMQDVLDASVSSAIAWPGISRILIERMIDKLAEPNGSKKTREEARKLLVKYRGLPLPLIEQRLMRD